MGYIGETGHTGHRMIEIGRGLLRRDFRWRLQSKHRLKVLIWGFLALLMPAGTAFMFSPFGMTAGLRPLNHMSTVSLMVFALAFGCVFIAGPFLFFSRSQKAVGKLMAICLFLASAIMVGGLLTEFVRYSTFSGVADRARVLMIATRDYEAKYGVVPTSLTKLVPEFLPALPDTNIGPYPLYRCCTYDEKRTAWVVGITDSHGRFGYEILVFCPGEKYPRFLLDGFVADVQNWWKTYE